MIAKGLDFPNVTLVGVIDADVGINMPDFRASERMLPVGEPGGGARGPRCEAAARWWCRRACQRTTRSCCAAAHDYEGFVAQELAARQNPPYPPFSRLANVIVSGVSETATMELAQSAGAWLHALVDRREPGALSIIGPAPCPIDRVKKRWRWHLLLKARESGPLTRVAPLLRLAVPGAGAIRTCG